MTDRVVPCLWVTDDIEGAVTFWCSLVPQSGITGMRRMPEGGPGAAGRVMIIQFRLGGRDFLALDGIAPIPFTEAVSLMLPCASQAEIDHVWGRLLDNGGSPVQCGWIRDRWGLSWQVFPAALPDLLADPDPARRRRVMDAMRGMVKLDHAALEAAWRG